MMPTQQEFKLQFLTIYQEILQNPNTILDAVIDGQAISRATTLDFDEVDSYFDEAGMVKEETPVKDERFYNLRQRGRDRYFHPAISQREELILYSVKMAVGYRMAVLDIDRGYAQLYHESWLKAKKVLNRLKNIRLDSPTGWQISADANQQITREINRLKRTMLFAKFKQKLINYLSKLKPEIDLSKLQEKIARSIQKIKTFTIELRQSIRSLKRQQNLTTPLANDGFSKMPVAEKLDNPEEMTEAVNDLLKSAIPEHVRLGVALASDDNFFAAITQSLIDIGRSSYTIKDLRVICHDYVIALDKGLKEENWIYQYFLAKAKKLNLKDESAAIQTAALNYQHYMANIRYTAAEIKAGEGLNIATAIKGKQNIEGRILCEKFGIKLHAVKASQVNEKPTLIQQLNGKKFANEDINYEDPDMIHIAIYGNAIVPLLVHNNGVNPTAEKDEAIRQQQKNKIKQQQKQRLFHKESLGISMGVMLVGAVLLVISGSLALTGIGGALGLPFVGIAAMIIIIGGLKSLYHIARLAFIPSHSSAESLQQQTLSAPDKQPSTIVKTLETVMEISQNTAQKTSNITKVLAHFSPNIATMLNVALIINRGNFWRKEPSHTAINEDTAKPSNATSQSSITNSPIKP